MRRDQHRDAGLVEHVLQLVRAVGRVDVDQDRADLGRGVLHQRPLGAGSAPRCRPGRPWPAPPRAGRARRVSTSSRSCRVGPPAAGRHLDQRLGVGLRGRRAVEVVADRVAEQRHVGRPGRVGRDGGRGSGHGGGPLTSAAVVRLILRRSAPRPPPPDGGGAPETRSRRADTLGRCTIPASCSIPPPTPSASSPGAAITLDVASLEKLLAARNSAIQRGRRGAGRVEAGRRRGEGRRRARSGPALVDAGPRAQGRRRARPRRSTAQRRGRAAGRPARHPEPAGRRAARRRERRRRRAGPQLGRAAEFDFTPLDHVDLGEQLGILDLPRATKLVRPAVRGAARAGRGAGAGDRAVLARPAHRAARLHRVLGAHAGQPGDDDRHRAAAEVRAGPVQDRASPTASCSSSPRPRCRSPTCTRRRPSAVEELPLAYTAHTPCFRSEAGSYGRDTRGLIRLHEFSKVELVRIVEAERSREELEVLLGHAEAACSGLGLAYRVVKLAAGDIGFSARVHLRHRGVAARPGPLPGDLLGVGLRHVPGPPRRHPHQGQGRQARLRRHPQRLRACRSGARWWRSWSRASRPTARSACRRRWCRTRASRS